MIRLSWADAWRQDHKVLSPVSLAMFWTEPGLGEVLKSEPVGQAESSKRAQKWT